MHEEAQRLVTSAAPPLSLRDRAYLEIKRRINRLEYRPGAYLNEAQISRRLKVGRTPAHQALDRLMLEGLIQVIPRKGVVVQSISLDEVLHILELRLVNEPYCVGLAVERATPQEITRMRELLGSAAPLIRARDREKLMNLDRALHHQISLAARNPILADMLTLLHERSLRFWLISFGDALQLRRVDDEHRNILEACGRSKRMSAPSPTD
jgi:GntR family transcriptional regulator, rspAB operon transcriptional repressor